MSTENSSKLLDEVRNVMRLKHYSIHTERSYISWIVQFVKFHGLLSRNALLVQPEKKIEDFLTHLAVHRNIAASTSIQGHEHSGSSIQGQVYNYRPI